MTGDGNAISYEYDHYGIRVSSTVNGVKTRYLVDKNRDYAQVLEEIDDASGSLIVAYVYGDDLISQKRGSETYYYLYDGQMSTRMLTDSIGAITDEYIYDAFGILLNSTGSTENNYLYTGEQYDPNVGFYYLRARYYDQTVGRFVSGDSWEGNDYDPQSLHKYNYVHHNPINYYDPSGNMLASLAMGSGFGRSGYTLMSSTAFKLGMRILVKVAAISATYYFASKMMDDIRDQVFGSPPDHLRDETNVALMVMVKYFMQFLSSSEFNRQGKHWIEFMGHSGYNTTPKVMISEFNIGRVNVQRWRGGQGGRIFQFKYGIGRSQIPGQGFFLFRADYLDYTNHPQRPYYNPHYHLRLGSIVIDHEKIY